MKFDLIDLGKPEGEKLMNQNVWIGFQTVSDVSGGFIEHIKGGSRNKSLSAA